MSELTISFLYRNSRFQSHTCNETRTHVEKCYCDLIEIASSDYVSKGKKKYPLVRGKGRLYIGITNPRAIVSTIHHIRSVKESRPLRSRRVTINEFPVRYIEPSNDKIILCVFYRLFFFFFFFFRGFAQSAVTDHQTDTAQTDQADRIVFDIELSTRCGPTRIYHKS